MAWVLQSVLSMDLIFDYERLYTKDSDATPDMHLFRLRYEW